MTHPKETIAAAIKEAMKDKNNERRDALRLLQAAIKQVEIDTRQELTPEAVLDILQKEAKKRRESIGELTKAGRTEHVAAEQFELALIEEFLPKQLSQAEIEAIIQAAIASTGATSPKEMGKVMSVVTPQTKGLADGKLVSDLVKTLLSK
jgi:hypothetical protein